jgi:hypothetical protein
LGLGLGTGARYAGRGILASAVLGGGTMAGFMSPNFFLRRREGDLFKDV